MTNAFNCPNCSAPLDYKSGSGPTVRCPYCASSVIVPDGLRSDEDTHADFFWQPGTGLDALLQPDRVKKLKEIGDLARNGQRIDAIQLFRDTFQAGYEESRDAVDALEQGQAVDLSSMTVSVQSSPLDARTLANIKNLLQSGNKIEAIKVYRQATGAGLKQSKEAVEAIEGAVNNAPDLFTNGTYSINTISPQVATRVAKGVGAATAGVTCFTIGLVVFILVVTLVPIFFAFTSAGGPLGDWWAKTNPLSSNPVGLQFGGEGTGAGVFTDARHIGVDNQGHIFVGEFEGGRIQVFDSNGKYLTQWIASGAIGEGDIYLTGMAVDRNSIVYAVVGSDLFRYDGMTGEALTPLEHPEGWGFDDVTLGPDGSIVASWYKSHDDILKFTSDGQLVVLITEAISAVSGDSELSTRVAVDGSGNIYALGSFNEGIFIFASDGRYLNRFGSEGDAEGQFTSPYAIAVDNQSRVYVSDFGGIMVFASDGRYLHTLTVNGFVYDMCFDDQNNLFVVTSNEQVMEMSISR